MNTSTRASYANADQCHASTAKTPLLRPYGIVEPQASTSPISPDQWGANPDLHCQAIAAEYQWALEHSAAQLPITPQLCTDARTWLRTELATITTLGFWPVFTDAAILLTQTLTAFNKPSVSGEMTIVPVTGWYNEDIHPVWSPVENLLFRFAHDYHHWVTGADATFTGELLVTRHILTPAVRRNEPLARFLASEPLGQSALFITSKVYPRQIIARSILELI